MNTVKNPYHIKIGIVYKGYNEREGIENKLIMIYSPLNDFLASAYLSKLDDTSTFVINSPVARQGFGKVLIEASLMYVTQQGGMLASVRDGKNKSGIYGQLERMYNGEYGGSKLKLPDAQNTELKYTDSEEEPHLFFGYKLEPSSGFKASIVNQDRSKEKSRLESLDKEYEEVFFISYQENDTKWIDDDYPLNIHFKKAFLEESNDDFILGY